jgi:hypothetical protein
MSDISTDAMMREAAMMDASDNHVWARKVRRLCIERDKLKAQIAAHRAALAPDAVPIPPLRYFSAEGETLDQIRDHARAHPIAGEGDTTLVWVNEGDLYNHSAPFFPPPVSAPVAVRVKPLEWEESLKGRWIGTPDSKLGDLAFWIFRHHDGTLKRATKEGWQFYPTLEAAKAAAQADYERRILAALDTPAPRDG